MRSILLTLLIASTTFARAEELPNVAETFEGWAKYREDFKSLSVEFQIRRTMDIYRSLPPRRPDEPETRGEMKVIRDEKGQLRVAGTLRNRYEEMELQQIFFANGTSAYLLYPDDKVYWKADDFRSPDLSLVLLPLADRTQIENRYDMIFHKKVDDRFRYLFARPKRPDLQCDWVYLGLAREGTDWVPKGVPQTIWHKQHDFTVIEITSWKVNSFEPSEDQFVLPEDRRGWRQGKFNLFQGWIDWLDEIKKLPVPEGSLEEVLERALRG
jgi:hypothetical protein